MAASTGGTPTFVWDFGDGTVVDNNSTSLSHAYTSPGTYTVKLVGMNPVYGSVTRTIQIGIFALPSLSICEDGPIIVDYCGIQSAQFGGCTVTNTGNYAPVDIKATVSNGCPSSYTYAWDYRLNGGSWTTTSVNSSTYTFYPPSVVGTYEFRCTVTDACGKTSQATSFIDVYRSDSNCNGGVQN